MTIDKCYKLGLYFGRASLSAQQCQYPYRDTPQVGDDQLRVRRNMRIDLRKNQLAPIEPATRRRQSHLVSWGGFCSK